jgi:hypothetical protein
MIDRLERELAPGGPTAPLYSPYDPACPELDVHHPLYWRYGQNAGGVVLTTERFYGKKMREVPWSFLVDCERMGRDTKQGCWVCLLHLLLGVRAHITRDSGASAYIRDLQEGP